VLLLEQVREADCRAQCFRQVFVDHWSLVLVLAGDGADADDALHGLHCSWADGGVELVLVRLAVHVEVQKWVVCHVRGHKSAQFLVYIHSAVHVEVGMVQGMFEEPEVASGLLPQPVLPLGPLAMYAPEHELVVACSDWQYLCSILSE